MTTDIMTENTISLDEFFEQLKVVVSEDNKKVSVCNDMISAKLIAWSVMGHNNPIITYELSYPRFIHAEFMTHRLFSRNAASSRAIPINKMLDMIRQRPAAPITWGLNQAGMQSDRVAKPGGYREATAEYSWNMAAKGAVKQVENMNGLQLHKQIVNRIIEPFTFIKVVMTSTEMANFFNLRHHKDAQPEIHALAICMDKLMKINSPKLVLENEWHMPYYKDGIWTKEHDISWQQAVKISASCAAQVSYRTNDDSLEKAERIYDRLINSKPAHSSPMEHQATPFVFSHMAGVTAMDIADQSSYWSGNFKNWIQYRQLLDGHAVWDNNNNTEV